MLAYQFGYDQYVFAVGGEKLVQESAIPFRDVMDTKPMLMMYIYGWASAIFGYTIYSIRIVDVLYHLVALYVYFRLLRTYFANESVAYIAVAIYALQYVSTGAAATAQAESFALLPTLGILYATGKIEQIQKKKDILYLITLTSVCAFVLFALKITLIMIPLVICTWKIIDGQQNRKRHLVHFVGMLVGCCIFILCLLVWLSANGAIPFVKEYFVWLSDYKFHSDTLNSFTVIKDYYQEFVLKLSDTTPLALLLLASLGIYVSVAKKTSFWVHREYTTFLAMLSATVCLLLFENKYILYQYGLFWWTLSAFAALGLYSVFILMREYFARQGHKTLSIFVFGPLIIFVLFFSPIIAVYDNLHQIVFANERNKGDFIEFFRPSKSLRNDLDSVQAKLAAILMEEDKIFFFGHHVGVYFHSNTLPATMLLTSAFFSATWTPIRWKKILLNELMTDFPSYIVIEENDAVPITNNSPLDSRQHFENWEELAAFTHTNYAPLDSTEKFIIYKRVH